MSDPFVSENPGESSIDASSASDLKRVSYWDARFTITIIILLLIAFVAAYLQYELYPTIMQNPPFLESNISLHVSILTYSYNAVRCADGGLTPVSSCPVNPEHIVGVPAFDFFQLFVLIVILASLYHFFRWQRSK